MNGKIYTDSEVGEVKLVRSVRARRISIRVHPVKGVTVTVPCFAGYDSGLKFYQKLVFQMEANSIAFMDILNQPVQK